jgi:hypothetical protein
VQTAIPQPASDRARKQAALRQRKRRQLVKAGLVRFTISADSDRLAAYLITTGRIGEIEARAHQAVEEALSLLVVDLLERFGERHA